MLLASSYSDGDDSLGLRVTDDGEGVVATICRCAKLDCGEPTGIDDLVVVVAATGDRSQPADENDRNTGAVVSPQNAGHPS